MTQGLKCLVIVQRPGLLLVISTSRLANQSHDSVPLKIRNVRESGAREGRLTTAPALSKMT